jgi:hypothetical protein
MNDFHARLGTLLDDVAATISPRPDFAATRSASVPVVAGTPGGARRFPRSLGVAAVSIALFGGGVAAFQAVDRESDSVATAPAVTSDEPERVVRTEPAIAASDDPVTTGAPAADRPPADERAPIVAVADAIERSARLGGGDLTGDPMRQEFAGRAAPGETITVTSEHGSATTTANLESRWAVLLTLTGVAEGRDVAVRVTFGSSPAVFEFVLTRPPAEVPETTAPPVDESDPTDEPAPKDEPEPVAFTANLGSRHDDETVMKQGFWGTAPAPS